jgi:predicted CXXCH cytochrome family protein
MFEGETKSAHQPVVTGDCTGCHSPHQALLDSMLLAASPDLCLSCHDEVTEKMDSQRVHQPAGEDCLQCHQAHRSNERSLLNLPIQDLCSECHDVEEDSFKESHIYIKAAVMDCGSCHAPHASKDRSFFKETMHSPFVKGNCDDCHIVGAK